VQPSSRALYFRILAHFRPYTWAAVLTVIAMVISSLTDVMLIGQLRVVTDTLSHNAQNATQTSMQAAPAMLSGLTHQLHEFAARVGLLGGTGAPLWVIPAVMLALAIVRMASSFAGEYGGAWLVAQLQHDMRGRLFTRILQLPTRFFDHASVGATLSRVAFDVSQVSQAGLGVISVSVRDSASVIGYFVLMLTIDWKLTLFCLILGPCVGLIINFASRRMRRLSRGNQEAMAEMTRVLDESIGGQRVVKIFGGALYERRRFDAVANQVRRFSIKQSATSALNSGLIMLLVGVMMSAIIYFALLRANQGAITGGAFIAFLGALMALLTPIKNLTKINEQLQRGLAAAESVFDLMDEASEADTGTQRFERVRGEIRFQQVRFRYNLDDPESREALAGIELTVQPGETVALVGASGSGKTTIASLMPRFYDPVDGAILLDGVDLRDVSLANLRQQIALVSQDVILFNDTIAANIAYGDENPDRARVEAAGKAAYAHEFIAQMPSGYDTLIGENGTRLSGGQRQRLAIARALYKDAPILILDEATSALDTESERQVQAALEVLMQGRTTLIIAHRLSTIENADRILAMHQGRIVESGTHEELLAQEGVYAGLYRQQRTETAA
jgi:subfamily B ATP-binding cassette protein MsbA